MPDWLIVGVNFGNGAKILCHGIIKAMMAADLGDKAAAMVEIMAAVCLGDKVAVAAENPHRTLMNLFNKVVTLYAGSFRGAANPLDAHSSFF